MADKWLQRHMALAQFVRGWSKDPSTQVGAVIVSGQDRRSVAIGYNGFPPGVRDTPERLANREVKYHFTQHAERAVLDNASFDVRGATLYVTMHPCVECAKSIIAKGLSCVVCPPAPDREPWATSSKFAREAMTEAGIKIIEVEDTTTTVTQDLLGALKFILAFYEPGQRHLDTEAWKVAEASARAAVKKAEGS